MDNWLLSFVTKRLRSGSSANASPKRFTPALPWMHAGPVHCSDGLAVMQRTPGVLSVFRFSSAHGMQLVTEFKAHPDKMNGVAIAPNHRLLATASESGHCSLWDMETGTHKADLPGRPGQSWAGTFSPDCRSKGTTPVSEPDSIATRQSLLARLKDVEDQESWRDFFET